MWGVGGASPQLFHELSRVLPHLMRQLAVCLKKPHKVGFMLFDLEVHVLQLFFFVLVDELFRLVLQGLKPNQELAVH